MNKGWYGAPGSGVPAPDVIDFPWSLSGAITVQTGVHQWYNAGPYPYRLWGAWASLGTAPTGSSATFDVKLNGTTSFFEAARVPTILAGNKWSGLSLGTSDGWSLASYNTVINPGQFIVGGVLSVGATVAGSDLVVAMRLVRVF